VQASRLVVQQEPERGVHLVGVDQVVVVQHQQHLVRLGGQLVDQGRHQALKRPRRRPEQWGDPLADARPRPV
jgi:hypothetical protein